jgi:hypothetical protein
MRWTTSPPSDGNMWCRSVSGAVLVVLATTGAVAGEPRDLRNVPAGQEVVAVRLCRGQYDVALRDGSHRTFPEYSLVFKLDTSDSGPPFPALVPSLRAPWRASIVFPSIPALMATIYSRC